MKNLIIVVMVMLALPAVAQRNGPYPGTGGGLNPTNTTLTTPNLVNPTISGNTVSSGNFNSPSGTATFQFFNGDGTQISNVAASPAMTNAANIVMTNVTVMFTNTFDTTNQIITSGADQSAFNGTFTWNATLNAYTNTGVAAYYYYDNISIMDWVADTTINFDGNPVYYSNSGVLDDFWDTNTGTTAPKVTHGFTTVKSTNTVTLRSVNGVYVASQCGFKFGTNNDTGPAMAVLQQSLVGNRVYLKLDGGMSYATHLTIYSNTTIEGVFPNCGFKLNDHADDYLLTTLLCSNAVASRNLHLKNVTFDGNKNNNSKWLGPGTDFFSRSDSAPAYNFTWWFQSYDGLTIEGCTFTNSMNFALTLGGFAYNTVIKDTTLSWDTGVTNLSNHDGIHLFGDNYFGHASNIKMVNLTDDAIAANTDENCFAYNNGLGNPLGKMHTLGGVISDWKIEHVAEINPSATGGNIRFIAYEPSNNIVRNFIIRDITGRNNIITSKPVNGFNTLVTNILIDGMVIDPPVNNLSLDLFGLRGTGFIVDNFINGTNYDPTPFLTTSNLVVFAKRPVKGSTTNITITAGPTLYITNGVIGRVQ